MRHEAKRPTPWAVRCECNDGELVYMTLREYHKQLAKIDALWKCPRCGRSATWDDVNYEQRTDLGGLLD